RGPGPRGASVAREGRAPGAGARRRAGTQTGRRPSTAARARLRDTCHSPLDRGSRGVGQVPPLPRRPRRQDGRRRGRPPTTRLIPLGGSDGDRAPHLMRADAMSPGARPHGYATARDAASIETPLTEAARTPPLGLGWVGLVAWDERPCSFGPGLDLLREHGVVATPLPFLLDALEHSYRLSLVPSVAAFDVGFTRTMVLLARAGKLRPPLFLKIFLSGAWAVGPFPTEEALDFHLQQIPP